MGARQAATVARQTSFDGEIQPDGGLGRWRAPAAGLAAGLTTVLWSWHPSLWSDEAATISAASRSVADLRAMLGTLDLVHGAYYLLMHWWIDLFGASAFSIRLPSAIAVGVAGACVYCLGARLSGPNFAVWSVGVFAVLPRVFWAGAEARPYAFTAMFTAAATLVLLIALDRSGRALPWVGYALLLVAGVLTNIYVGLLVAAHLVSVLWDRRLRTVDRVRWLISAGAAVVVTAPFVVAAHGQTGQLSDRSLGPAALLRNVAVNQWFLGDTPTATSGAAHPAIRAGELGSWWVPAAVLLALTCWALAALAVVRNWHTLAGSDGGRPPALVWLLPWIVLPTAVIGLYSIAVTPMYTPRYLTFCAPAVALLIATGLTALRPGSLRVVTAAVLVVCAMPILVSQRQLYAKNSSDWVSVASYVGARAEPGDGIYFAPRWDLGERIVGQTTRGIVTAYPADFLGLKDLTLLRSPVQAHNLAGQSRYLRQSTAELATVDTVWVIRRTDYPQAGADDDFLISAGFARSDSWRGPLDTVLRFARR
jgi:mannosyltransferase